MDALRLTTKVVKSLSFWNLRRVFYLARTQGPAAVLDRALYAMGNKDENRYRELEARPRELRRQRKNPLPWQPKISLAVAVYNPPVKYLEEVLESVVDQTYPNWELCIADGGSTREGVHEVLEAFAKKYADRVKLTLLPENLGIAGNQNAALAMCTGDYLGIIDHDDIVLPNALYEMADRFNQEPDIELIYSDETICDENAEVRKSAHLKPDYAPDTLRGANYFCHLTLYRKDLMEKLGGLKPGYDGAQDYDLVLRATETAKKIAHVPKVLYLWRQHDESTALNIDAKPYAYLAGQRAIKDHLDRIGLPAKVDVGYGGCTYRIEYQLKATPKVSIVIPNRDHGPMLKNCVASILEQSTYPNLEIVIVENGSQEACTFAKYRKLQADPRVRVVRKEVNGPFNYPRLMNFGSAHATGDYLLHLNNDTEVITPNWIEKMMEYGQRDDVGIVGAKLVYPDNYVQHGGVILGIQGVAGHSHKCVWGFNEPGYLGRLVTVQNLSAVTGACMLVRKSLFDELGGFDEEYAVAFNDIDFCLRARQKGVLVVWTPEAVLYHFESRSRGYEDTPAKVDRLKREIALFQDRWRAVLKKGDPYYHPNLSLLAEDFRLGSPFDGITMPNPF